MAESKEELIKAHRKILIQRINVLRRLNLTQTECLDHQVMRRFCHKNGLTLPDMIEIQIETAPETDTDYAWYVSIYEQPNLQEEASA